MGHNASMASAASQSNGSQPAFYGSQGKNGASRRNKQTNIVVNKKGKGQYGNQIGFLNKDRKEGSEIQLEIESK